MKNILSSEKVDWFWPKGALLIIAGLMLLLPAILSGAAPAEKTLYTCGMHPQVIQDHPGDCPICGMRLIPVRRQPSETAAAVNVDAPVIAVDPVTTQKMNVRTEVVRSGPVQRVIHTVGMIAYNETTLSEVSLKFRGWIERLDVDATGQLVHRGQPLFDVYSPDLYSAEQEYLQALSAIATNDTQAIARRNGAADRLRFLDISEEQINALAKAGTPRKTMSMLAPGDGVVTEKLVVQGQMVEAGQALYRLADLGIVWVYAQIYEEDLPLVKLGQEAVVKVASLPDRQFRGRVTFVYPTVDEKTRTARVRMEFENPGYFLKPGMFVSVDAVAEGGVSVVLVPDSAVLRSGAKNTVFLAFNDGRFEARTVQLGAESGDDLYEVLSGLKEGDRVVTSGQFMLDSESQLREVIAKMNAPSAPANAATSAPSPAQPATADDLTTEDASVVYVCPMPEHVSIVYNHPGNCPICGMALVPVNASELKKLPPGGKVLYYTCPMPEHASVHQDKPGKCPLCGMTLIPVMAPVSTVTNQPN